MSVLDRFREWGLGYSGCDGGDVGNRGHRAVWVCGIEWGGGHDPNELCKHIQEDVSTPPRGYSSWKENLGYIFNWQVMKLLAVIEGRKVSEYKSFAEDAKPFVDGFRGYFKMNLFPIAFRNTNSTLWAAEFSAITGFSSKHEYLQWCRSERLPQQRKWVQTWMPELVICLGKTYREDFTSAFSVPSSHWVTEIIDQRDVSWAVNDCGALVVVLPFMVNSNGLVRNASIQRVGERIAQLRCEARSGVLGCCKPEVSN